MNRLGRALQVGFIALSGRRARSARRSRPLPERERPCHRAAGEVDHLAVERARRLPADGPAGATQTVHHLAAMHGDGRGERPAHLDTVPAHRKLNRIDLGTADKLAVAALAIQQRHERTGRPLEEISLIVLELGGAFTAAIAVHRGQVVDGLGGTSGPIGWKAAGALDGEVVYLAGGPIDKAFLFQGGVETVAQSGPGGRLNAIEAYLEGAAKAVHLLAARHRRRTKSWCQAERPPMPTWSIASRGC